MPVFCGTEFLWHRASLLRLETHVLPIAVCKSTRIRLVPNSWDSYAGFCGTELWGPKPVIPTNVLAAFAISFCQRHCVSLCKGTKAKEFGEAEFWDSMPVGTVCRFSMEGSCIGFWKSKANSTFCKVVKQKGETFWPPLQPGFA